MSDRLAPGRDRQTFLLAAAGIDWEALSGFDATPIPLSPMVPPTVYKVHAS